MKTEVNLFSILWTRTSFPLTINGVLENVLVCAQIFIETSKCYLIIMFMVYHTVILMFGPLYFLSFLCSNCALVSLTLSRM